MKQRREGSLGRPASLRAQSRNELGASSYAESADRLSVLMRASSVVDGDAFGKIEVNLEGD